MKSLEIAELGRAEDVIQFLNTQNIEADFPFQPSQQLYSLHEE